MWAWHWALCPFLNPGLKIYFNGHGSQNFTFNHVSIIHVLIMESFLQIYTMSIYFFFKLCGVYCTLVMETWFGWQEYEENQTHRQTDRNCSLGSNGLYLLLWSTPIMHQCRTSAHMFLRITQREKLARLGRCFKHAFSSCKHQRGESCSS